MSIAAADIGTVVPPAREPNPGTLTAVPGPAAGAPAYTAKATTVAPPPPAPSRSRKEPKAERPWYSGWCGPGPCRDGMPVAGEPVRRCQGFARNGIKATRPISYCACTCHTDPAAPGA